MLPVKQHIYPAHVSSYLPIYGVRVRTPPQVFSSTRWTFLLLIYLQLQKTVLHLWGIGAISAPVSSESTVL